MVNMVCTSQAVPQGLPTMGEAEKWKDAFHWHTLFRIPYTCDFACCSPGCDCYNLFPWWPNQDKRCFPLTCVVRNMIYFWLHLPHLWLRLIQGFSIKAKARGKAVPYDSHCNLVHHAWWCCQHDHQCTGLGGSVHQTAVPGITFPYLNNTGAAKNLKQFLCLPDWRLAFNCISVLQLILRTSQSTCIPSHKAFLLHLSPQAPDILMDQHPWPWASACQ